MADPASHPRIFKLVGAPALFCTYCRKQLLWIGFENVDDVEFQMTCDCVKYTPEEEVGHYPSIFMTTKTVSLCACGRANLEAGEQCRVCRSRAKQLARATERMKEEIAMRKTESGVKPD